MKNPPPENSEGSSARNKVNQSQMFAFAINPIYTPCANVLAPRL